MDQLTNTNNNRIIELDSLRGIAIILILLTHLTLSIPTKDNIFRFGVTGVDLFFLISGFVIFLTIERTEKIIDFIIARFGRIYPAYWVGLLYTYILYRIWCFVTGLTIRYTVPHFFTNLTMFQHFLKSPNIISPSWTLLVEMQFYILIVLLFLCKQVKNILPFVLSSLLFVGIYCLCLANNVAIHSKEITFYFPLINYLPLFLSGILFYKLKYAGVNYLFIGIIAILFILQIVLFKNVGTNRAFTSVVEYAGILFIYYLLFTLLTFNKLGFIKNRLTIFLGKISYSLYLIHLYPSWLLINYFTNSKKFHFNLWLVILFVVLPYILFTAYLLNKFIERPCIDFFRKYINRNRSNYLTSLK